MAMETNPTLDNGTVWGVGGDGSLHSIPEVTRKQASDRLSKAISSSTQTNGSGWAMNAIVCQIEYCQEFINFFINIYIFILPLKVILIAIWYIGSA